MPARAISLLAWSDRHRGSRQPEAAETVTYARLCQACSAIAVLPVRSDSWIHLEWSGEGRPDGNGSPAPGGAVRLRRCDCPVRLPT
jgi:hypothetical protein